MNPTEHLHESQNDSVTIRCCCLSLNTLAQAVGDLFARRVDRSPIILPRRIEPEHLTRVTPLQWDAGSASDLLNYIGLYANPSRPNFSSHLSHLQNSAEQRESLTMWLSRLRFIKDYQISPQLKQELLTRVIHYLEIANEDEEFRDAFFRTIYDAGITCGDRVALSILYLDLAYDSLTISKNNLPEIAEFIIRGPATLSILEQIAREKMKYFDSLRDHPDELELYLAYPILLKNALQIPIQIKSMVYFPSSKLKLDDLKQAVSTVSDRLTEESIHNILINFSLWTDALERKYPAKTTNFKRERDLALDKNPDDCLKIYEKYNQQLASLTQEVLEGEGFVFTNLEDTTTIMAKVNHDYQIWHRTPRFMRVPSYLHLSWGTPTI